jgi:nucleotide sugar dehydrogenase
MSSLYQSLENKINNKQAKIGVIGLGQVGLPTALTFSNVGFTTTGHDINSNLMDLLEQGKSPFEEHGLENLLKNCIENKKFFTEKKLEDIVKNSDVIIICVATPITNDVRPNLSALENVCNSISGLNLEGKLVLIESSIPPYTFEELVMPIITKKHSVGNNFWIAFVPERLSPGEAISGIQSTPRLIGIIDDESGNLAKSLYKNIVAADILISPVRVAEISKLVENTFRDVNVALANEISLICEKYGVDIIDVRKVCNSHPRVNLLSPGPGVGGPCLPKDPYLLLNPRDKNPIQSNIIIHARKTNDQISFHVIDLIEKGLKDVNKNFSNSCILVLGVTYKANVSDTRYSPASKIIPNLIEKGAKVLVNDPFSEENFGGTLTPNIWESISESDLILVLTDHLEFRSLSLEKISEKMNTPLIVDCRRIFDKSKAEKLGINYVGIGLGIK